MLHSIAIAINFFIKRFLISLVPCYCVHTILENFNDYYNLRTKTYVPKQKFVKKFITSLVFKYINK